MQPVWVCGVGGLGWRVMMEAFERRFHPPQIHAVSTLAWPFAEGWQVVPTPGSTTGKAWVWQWRQWCDRKWSPRHAKRPLVFSEPCHACITHIVHPHQSHQPQRHRASQEEESGR